MDETQINNIIDGMSIDVTDIISDIKDNVKTVSKKVQAVDNDRYNFIILDWNNNKLAGVKLIKDLEGFGLKEAKDLIDLSGTPFTYKTNLSKEEYSRFYQEFSKYGIVCRGEKIDPTKPIPICTRKTGLELYQEYINPKLDYIKSELEGYYPDLWDMEDLSNLQGSIVFKNKYDNIGQVLSALGHSTAYKFYIKFPEFVIKNSQRKSRVIKDLFIRIQLRYDLKSSFSGSYFQGWRATKDMSEHNSHYSHSHLPRTDITYSGDSDCFASFCLGNTTVANNSSALGYEFNEDNFSLMLQQIKDYIVWESLEGGPHIRMSDISDNKDMSPDISAVHNESIYTKFLEKNSTDIPYSTNKKSFIDLVTIPREGLLDKLVTKLLTEESTLNKYLVFYNSSTKERFIFRGERNSGSTDADSINRSRDATKVRFKFKGEDISYKVYVNADDNSGNLEKVANPNIVEYIANKLEKLINKELINDIRNSK